MFIQIIFSLIAIGFLYLLNKKLGGFTPTEFENEQMAMDVVKADIPDNSTQKLGPMLFLNRSTALFEFIESNKNNADSFCLSQAMGDVFVSRQLPTRLLIEAAKKIKAANNHFMINIDSQDITLPSITINFNDTDPLYYWLVAQKLSIPTNKTQEVANAVT